MEGPYVLAIEHDWRLCKLIRANLEALGIRVRVAVSGKHGLKLLEEYQPDLVLLDLDLPDTDALKLLTAVRNSVSGNSASIIVLAEEPPSQQWRQDTVDVGYLQKPFAAPALLDQVEKALASRAGKGPKEPHL
jgi:DNA-binding response OmpR family regulator